MTNGDLHPEEVRAEWDELEAKIEAAKVKCRHGLSERVFIACDSIKRLWRKANSAISSYWKDLENTVKHAINNPGETFTCRKLKVRRDGALVARWSTKRSSTLLSKSRHR